MKTALIILKERQQNLDAGLFSNVLGLFNAFSVEIDSINVLEEDDLSVKKVISDYRNTVDNLIVFSGKDYQKLKQTVAEVYDTVLTFSEKAQEIISAKFGDLNEREELFLFPMDFTVVPNEENELLGCMTEDEEFTLIILPSFSENAKAMVNDFVLPYIKTKYGIDTKTVTLKYFGGKDALDSAIKKAEGIYQKPFNKYIDTVFGDTTLKLVFKDADERYAAGEAIRFLVTELKDGIYAETDTSLSQRVFDLLRLKNLKLSVAESFTAGRVVASVINNSGASAYVNEGIVSYSNLSKHKRLNVKNDSLISQGAVSSQVAYEMATGLLFTGDCDIAVSTTGIAGPKSDDTLKPVGLCYIGVGTKQGVHVYKYNLTGNREEITETAKNIALFLTIKNLKKI